jgi:hypothetical protein
MPTTQDAGRFVRLRKLSLGALILGVLAAQAYFVLPHPLGGTYWPFLTYTMYSTPHYAGQPIALRELRAGPCEGHAMTVLDHESLRVPQHRLRALLAFATGAPVGMRTPDAATAARARATLSDLVRLKLGPQGCRLQIWARTYRLGRSDPGAPVPLLLEREWRASTGDLTRRNTR